MGNDNSYYIRTETGFSCHAFSTKYGFHADKNGNQGFGRHWREVTNFRTSGTYALYNIGGGFNAGQGRYYAPSTGYYFCSNLLRLDSASAAGYFRINMVLNRGADVNNGFHGIRGNKGSTYYGTLGVAGSVRLSKGWTMSTYLYSSSDNSFTVQSESGFGCHQMAGGVGFHADAYGDQVFGRGWARLARWRASGNNELYSVGGGLGTTWYTAPRAGYYMCATQLRIDSASNTRFRMIIALDNGMDTHNGLHVSDGNQGSTNYRTMRIMGTVYLKKGVRTSVHVYSASDNSWRLQHESGFSCHKFAASAGGTLPGTTLKCGSVAGPICMGHNIKCWRTSLANCKATCKATAGCKIAEYSTGGTCCTSKYASKSDCPGSFTTSSAWKGYVVC